METVGIEPTSVCLQDRLACPWHMRPPFASQKCKVKSVFAFYFSLFTLNFLKLRRPDSNRRRTAYETVLESRLQSTPQ